MTITIPLWLLIAGGTVITFSLLFQLIVCVAIVVEWLDLKPW